MKMLRILSVILIVGVLIGAGFFALAPGSNNNARETNVSEQDQHNNVPVGPENEPADNTVTGTKETEKPAPKSDDLPAQKEIIPEVEIETTPEDVTVADAETETAPVDDRPDYPNLQSGFLTENVGQFPVEDMKYFGRVADMVVSFGDSTVYYLIQEQPDLDELETRSEVTVNGVFVKITFSAANVVEPVGINKLPHNNNYFIGSDPDNWYTDVGNYGGVFYENLYDGIDLVYKISDDGIKYNFIVNPGADPDVIEIDYDGINDLRIVDGSLVISTEIVDLIDSAPHSYQGLDEVVGSAFELRGATNFGFTVSEFDGDSVLVIDPLVYSTFLGGDHQDYTRDIKVDSAGCAYVIGTTWAHTNPFPTTTGAYQTTHAGGVTDAFITKLNANGSALIFSTFLGGGTNSEEGFAIAIDSSNNVYAGGRTTSSDFPTTAGAFDTTFGGGTSMDDGWVSKLNPSGSSLLFSTYLGGSGDDEVRDIDVDASGNVFITGYGAGGYPTTSGAYDTSHGGGGFHDAFATKLNSSGAALDYSTLLGGQKLDAGTSISVDSSGNAYVFGETESNDYPNTTGALDNTLGGFRDDFITKVNPTGSGLVYSTYIGGSGHETWGDIAIDTSGNVYATGLTSSSDFYNTTGAYDNTYNGGNDIFALKLNAAGSALEYSTFIGGSSQDWGRYITVDGSGRAYIQGAVISTDFPTTPNAYSNASAGGQDVMIIVVSTTGDSLLYSSYFGGSASDGTSGIAVDQNGDVYITGSASSNDFPVTAGAYDTVLNSGTSTISDGYVSKLSLDLPNATAVEELLEDAEDIIDYIDGMDPGNFTNPNHQKTMKNKMEAVMKQIENGEYCSAANKLEHDILPKVDGEPSPNDWVTDPADQQALEDMILALIEELRTLGGC